MYRLVIEDDEGRTTLVPLIREEFSIGRREGNSIRLTQRNVSRKHARVFRENTFFFVEDLGSYNGVRLNGERIAGRRSLREGDIVQIGDYHLMIQRERVTGKPANDIPPERETTPGGPIRAQVKTDPLQRVPEEAEKSSAAESNEPTAAVAAAGGSPTATAAAPEPAPATEGARFMVLTPALGARELVFDRARTTIGSEAEVSLPHRTLTKEHARVDVDAGTVVVHDLGGGVRVNGERYSERVLRDGDLLELGGVKLRFAGRSLPAMATVEQPSPSDGVTIPRMRRPEGLSTTPPERTDSGRPSAAPSVAESAVTVAKTQVAKPSTGASLDAELGAFAPVKAVKRSTADELDDEPPSKRRPLFILLGVLGLGALATVVYFAVRPSPPPSAPIAPRVSPNPPAPAPKPDRPAVVERRPARPANLGALPAETPPPRVARAEPPESSPFPPDNEPEPAAAPREREPETERPKPKESAPAPEPKIDEIHPMPEPAKPPPPPTPVPPQAIEKKPSADENLARAKELLEEGTKVLLSSPPQAIGILRRALTLAPRLADVHRQLGIAYNATGNDIATARHLRRYLQLRPGAGDAGEVKRMIEDAEKGAR